MSVRRRAVSVRVERTRAYDAAWAETTASLQRLQSRIETCIADRDAHRRLDDDGSPTLPTPYDPYFDLVQATVELNSRPAPPQSGEGNG